jgi:hypothetical protein
MPTDDGLIEALTKAEKPDRDLANQVLFTCGWKMDEEDSGPHRTQFWIPPGSDDESYVDGDQPNPLLSINAAMDLVPNNFVVVSLHNGDLDRKYLGVHKYGVWKTTFAPVGWHLKELGDIHGLPRGEHSSPAIALCIAAVRARSHQQQEKAAG